MTKKKYRVVVWGVGGSEDEDNQILFYYPKWVAEWPKDPSKWGARYELSPNSDEAMEVGRDTALEIAHTIRLRNGSWAMVEEA